MTAVAQFFRIPAVQGGFRTITKTGQQPVTMTAVKLAGSCCGQAGGALRETTQPRNHDPTAQKQR
jgi:hypothetical protein